MISITEQLDSLDSIELLQLANRTTDINILRCIVQEFYLRKEA